MSRFFAPETSSSESSSDEDEIEPQARAPAKFVESSSESEEERRIVKSARDKRYEELQAVAHKLKNHRKNRDMAAVQGDFEEMTRSYEKAKKVLEGESGIVPRFYIRALAELEDFVNEVWKDTESRKSMSKIASRALTQLRQKVKKYNKENLETQVAHFRENPAEYESEKEDKKRVVSESEDEDDGGEAAAAKLAKAGKTVSFEKKKDFEESDISDSDDDFGSTSDETSSSSSSDGEYGGNLAAKFLKKPGSEEKEKKKMEERKKRKTERAALLRAEQEKKKQEGDDEEGWKQVPTGKGGITIKERAAIFPKDAKITHELVMKKLDEIKKGRGKRGTDRTEMIEILIDLQKIVVESKLGLGLQVKLLFEIIGSIFDYNPNIASSMRGEIWSKCTEYYSKLLSSLEAHTEELTVGDKISDESESLQESPFRVTGCPLTMLERLDEEYTKMLQNTDAHSQDYVERLRDERGVCELIDRLVKYMEKRPQTNTDEMCRSYIRKIEHLYYKFDQEWARKVEAEGLEVVGVADSYREMERLCHVIYAGEHQRTRTRSILCHIYFLALHDYWFEARDLMLMSNLQQSIDHADISTMILYNRAMVQLGLCAFRKGQLRDCHASLVDIQSSGRAKELLAQGLMPARYERTPEQEKLERRRQMPYHMHINLELLECVYLVSAMLLEIPYIAAHEMDLRRRMISKNFHHVLKISERQTLVGPPETMREHIVAASKAMRNGDWKSTRNNIINTKMNAKVWDLFFQADKVKEMLEMKIKEESLRTFLFTYGAFYDALSLDKLSVMFDLERTQVHSIISKMILSDELSASLDEPSACMIMHRTEPTRLQTLSLQLAEKVSALHEANEKLAEAKQAGTGRDLGAGGGYQDGYRGRGGGDRGDRGEQRDGGQYGGGSGGSGYRNRTNRGRGTYNRRNDGNREESGFTALGTESAY